MSAEYELSPGYFQLVLTSRYICTESSSVDVPDGDNGMSIGPLQISLRYHHDAWRGGPKADYNSCRYCGINGAETGLM